MNRCLLLLFLWLLLPLRVALAQPDTAGVVVRRLLAYGLLLDKGWKYHAGDNLAWARSDFDDRAWNRLRPTRRRREQPLAAQTGISWWRLRFRLSDHLRQRELLLQAWGLGACEVYLNGQRVLHQGILNADPARVQPCGPLPPPGTVPAGGAAEQVLAVRFAPWQPRLLFGLGHQPQLMVFLLTPQQYWQSLAQEKDDARIYLVLLGFSALLAFLHFAFFYYNPARRANRYFARFALTAALVSLSAYCAQTLPFATQAPYLVVAILTDLLAPLVLLWAMLALYALFNFPLGRRYAWLWGIYGGLVLQKSVALYHPATSMVWTLVIVLYTAEQLRLTRRALRQRQRGAGLIASGFAGGLLLMLAYAVNLFLHVMSPLLINVLPVLAFVLPALGISLFLAREFAQDAQLLQVQLGEVERLSAQTLAQELEKQALLAQQNETLEQQVQQRTGELQRSLTDLRATQTQLIQSEKMASLGELTAGIAHEIQNPLNFVNNFSELSTEMLEELQEALAANHSAEAAALAGDVAQNLGKIYQHGQRAASIVRGMLEHSRASSGERRLTDLNALCNEYLRLAYQGLRAKDKTFNTALSTDFAPGLPRVEAVASDLGRVLLNLFSNAFYAVHQRQQTGERGYAPSVRVSTQHVGPQFELRVSDNGPGIAADIQDKIFQPFFTTKPPGEGTGLGLSLAYDIITQGHGGTLTVESQLGEGTTFCVRLPLE